MRTLIAGACGLTLAAAIAVTAHVTAQPNPLQPNPLSKGSAYFHSNQSMEQKGAALLPEATKNNGFVAQNLESYPGSTTQLSVRTASGGGELHQRWQDNFFVVSGEATEITGGRVVDPKETAPGEMRGTRVEGGEAHLLRKGDVLHIAANTPHQIILAPGATFVYYVVKVEEPTARLMPAAK
jgi:mannose-6-phosphate isomerase-like protein (cupin superfamily)